MPRENPISHHDGKLHRYDVSLVPTAKIKPSPENSELYGEIDFNNDPALPMLKRSVIEKGLEEPLILTRDNFILSGHRRFHIVSILGWPAVPCQRGNQAGRRRNIFHTANLRRII
jgi:ParB-like chromosome segregation protein Spo0J